MLNLIVNAQRLLLQDVSELYAVVVKDPVKAIPLITEKLNAKGSGWSTPNYDRSDGFMSTWTYRVGTGVYGRYRFVDQMVDGKELIKVIFEAPYISLYDTYSNDLKTVGAEMVDSYSDKDGSLVNVYQARGFVFILARYPLSISQYTVEGKPTAYFKFLMHRAIN